MDKTLIALDELSRPIRRRHAYYTDDIVSTVATVIRNKLRDKGRAVFTRSDVVSMRQALIVANNQNLWLTWRHHDCFNAIIHELNTRRLIDSPYIKTPVKIARIDSMPLD